MSLSVLNSLNKIFFLNQHRATLPNQEDFTTVFKI